MIHSYTGKKTPLFAGIALFLLIIGVGALVYFQMRPEPKPLTPTPKKPVKAAVDPNILSRLPDNATEEQKVQRYREFQKAAQEAPYLEIQDCKPDPLIIKVLDKPTLTIKNSGDQDRTIGIEWTRYKVPAHGQFVLPLDFAYEGRKTESGIVQTRWWYTCDLYPSVSSGIIWVGIGTDR